MGQYTYNALEQRVIKTAGVATTVFIYDREGRLITEISSTGGISSFGAATISPDSTLAHRLGLPGRHSIFYLP